jgi:hypothetical protein
MKKLIFTLSLFCMVAVSVKAQYNYDHPSGAGACTPSLQYDTPGLYPISANLQQIVEGKDSPLTIFFVNYDSIANPVTGTLAYMDSLTVDSIGNLPTGYEWSTSSATNTFYNQTKGCIKIDGTCGSDQVPGQYQLFILVTVWTNPALLGVNPTGPIPASAAGLYYYVRVVSSTDTTTHPIDTAGQAAGTNIFVPYTNVAAVPAPCSTGLSSLDNNINSFKVYPNPFSTQTIVTFGSNTTGTFTEKLTDIIGNTIFSKSIGVTLGENTHTINRNNLAPGVYFYTISDGNNGSITKKVVIE